MCLKSPLKTTNGVLITFAYIKSALNFEVAKLHFTLCCCNLHHSRLMQCLLPTNVKCILLWAATSCLQISTLAGLRKCDLLLSGTWESSRKQLLMMEGIQSDKSHLLLSSVTVEKGGKSDIALSGSAENKAPRSDHLPANNFSAHRQWLCVTRCLEENFSSAGQEVLVILEQQKCKGQRLKPSLSSASVLANKIRVRVWSLDGKQVWLFGIIFPWQTPVCFPMFSCHSPGLEHSCLLHSHTG